MSATEVRRCECGCGQELPPPAGPGRPQRFAGDTCRQRMARADNARRDAIDIWDALKILDERPALAVLAALSPSTRRFLVRSLKSALSGYSDRSASRNGSGPKDAA